MKSTNSRPSSFRGVSTTGSPLREQASPIALSNMLITSNINLARPYELAHHGPRRSLSLNPVTSDSQYSSFEPFTGCSTPAPRLSGYRIAEVPPDAEASTSSEAWQLLLNPYTSPFEVIGAVGVRSGHAWSGSVARFRYETSIRSAANSV